MARPPAKKKKPTMAYPCWTTQYRGRPNAGIPYVRERSADLGARERACCLAAGHLQLHVAAADYDVFRLVGVIERGARVRDGITILEESALRENIASKVEGLGRGERAYSRDNPELAALRRWGRRAEAGSIGLLAASATVGCGDACKTSEYNPRAMVKRLTIPQKPEEEQQDPPCGSLGLQVYLLIPPQVLSGEMARFAWSLPS